jgi:hypothetical protein
MTYIGLSSLKRQARDTEGILRIVDMGSKCIRLSVTDLSPPTTPPHGLSLPGLHLAVQRAVRAGDRSEDTNTSIKLPILLAKHSDPPAR